MWHGSFSSPVSRLGSTVTIRSPTIYLIKLQGTDQGLILNWQTNPFHLTAINIIPCQAIPKQFSFLLTQIQTKTTYNKVPGQKAAFGLQQFRDSSMKWYHFSLLKQTISTVSGQHQILQASWKLAWEAAWPTSIWQLVSPAQKLKLYQPKLLFFAANWMWALIPTRTSFLPNLFIWGCHWPPGYTGHPNQTWLSGVKETSLLSLPGPTLAEQTHMVLEVPPTPNPLYNCMKLASVISSSPQDNVLQLFCPWLEDRRLFSNS